MNLTDAAVKALGQYPEILGVVLIAAAQLGMLWRRRGADHVARVRYGGSSSPLFLLMLQYTFICQLALLVCLPLRLLIDVLRLYVARC